jgi:hypothetical protein
MLDRRLLSALLAPLLSACGSLSPAVPMEPQPRSGGAAHMHDVGVEDVHPGQPTTCSDRLKNGTETDIDCGGGLCPGCGGGKGCLTASDCRSAVCTKGLCE